MASREEIIEKGVEAALTLAGETPWAALRLTDIATQAGLDLSDFHGVADKAALEAAVDPYFDKAMSREVLDMKEAPERACSKRSCCVSRPWRPIAPASCP